MKYWCLAACALLSNVGLAFTIVPNDAKPLDGQWRFKLEQDGDRPEHGKIGGQVPQGKRPEKLEPFEKTDYAEDAKWANITVPGSWEMAGFSPATYNQPDSAIGLYRLEFEVPADWKGRIVKVNFDGVQNGAEVYLNGQPVNVDESSEGKANYHQGGNTAFQADLTSAIKFGEKNLLAVRVYKNVNGVDLDTGDFFFLGGIHRSVTLFSVPQARVEDVKVETRLLPNDQAELKVIITKAGPDMASPTVTLEGATVAGNKIADGPKQAVVTQILDHPKLWSAEKPNLYTLNIDLKDSSGKVTEHISRRIGVREVSIKDGIFMVNNVPVKFTGICRHEVFADLGTTLNEEAWRKDITLMKAANINAIRTSHYPYASRFYDLCDELGMYVMDEMAAGWCDTTQQRLAPFFAQHARETVRRDKNHPCVVVWAVGNENKEGENNRVAADEMHKLDTTRPRLVSWRKGDQYGTELDDLHYTQPAEIVRLNAMTDRRKTYPLIFLENPNMWEERNGADYGDLDLWVQIMDRTWKVVWDSKYVPGNFLWEWQDRAIVDSKNPVHLYDYDPVTGVNTVKVKGICDTFRNPRASYYHVKMAYAPIVVEQKPAVDGSSVALDVTNRFSFTNLSEVTTTWHLMAGGKDLQSAEAHPQLAPLTRRKVKLDLPGEALSRADVLRVEFTHPDGRNLVTYDVRLKPEGDTTPKFDSSNLAGVKFPKFNLVSTTWGSNAIGWRTVFRHPAKLVNISANGSAVKDEESLCAISLSEIKSMDADVTLVEDSKSEIDGHVHAEFAGGKFTWNLKWASEGNHPSGRATRRTPAGTDVQELGWVFTMPGSDDHFSWHRKGYWSYYPPTHVGRISGTALPDSEDVHVTKITRPDAFDFNSTKYDCDWASLTNSVGNGLVVSFPSDTRQHCKAGTGKDGSRELIVNKYACPPRDISSNVVDDLYFTLEQGTNVEGVLRVGVSGQ